MKAVTFSQYGPPEVFQIKELDKPTPKENEILIRIHAVEVTKADCELRSFRFAVNWFWLPLRIVMGIRRPRKQVLGGYFSGIIEKSGPKVSRFSTGERIFGSTGIHMSAYAEYVCLPSTSTIVPTPDNLDTCKAAAAPLGALNALHFIRKLNLQKGESILINGAGGSIGVFAVQIAKSIGAEITAVDSGIKEKMLRKIGADHFMDYTKSKFTDADKRYDAVFNMVASQSFSACIKILKPNGRYAMANPRISDMLRSCGRSLFSNKKAMFAFAGETQNELLEITKMIENNVLSPVVDQTYQPEQISDAHHKVEKETRLGSIVLKMSNE